MAQILTVAEFKKRTIMPDEDVDYLETTYPDFLQTILDDWTDEILARLRKQYDVPAMIASPPRTVLRWLSKLATRDAYAKRGYNPSAASDKETIETAAERAEAELKEAADSKEGLFELPLVVDKAAAGRTRGGPLGYSESSPYVWTNVQGTTGRGEDRGGRGT